MVTAPLPRGIPRYDTDASLPGTDVLREISALSPVSSSELAGSPWWLSLRERIKVGVADPDWPAGCPGWPTRSSASMAARNSHSGAGTVTSFRGTWPGSAAVSMPGTGRAARNRHRWDSTRCTFHFQVAFVGRQRPVEEAVALAAGRARPALGALGVPPGQRDLLAPLHLLELTVRHEEARSSSGDRDMRFLPAVLPVIERGLATPPSVTVLHSAASSS